MELKDLKSAWNTYSSQELDKHHLGRESIHELLRQQTQTLVDRIDRNIKIGLGILLLFITYVVIDTVFLAEYFSKLLVYEEVEYPKWLEPLDIFTTALIVGTYLFFVFRYLKVRRNFAIDLHLNDLVKGILETLQMYRRMFYLAVFILLLNIVVGFAAVLYEAIKYSFPGGMESLATSKILLVIGVGMAVLIPTITITYLLLRGGFNNLYGRYMVHLNDTLKELDESE